MSFIILQISNFCDLEVNVLIFDIFNPRVGIFTSHFSHQLPDIYFLCFICPHTSSCHLVQPFHTITVTVPDTSHFLRPRSSVWFMFSGLQPSPSCCSHVHETLYPRLARHFRFTTLYHQLTVPNKPLHTFEFLPLPQFSTSFARYLQFPFSNHLMFVNLN